MLTATTDRDTTLFWIPYDGLTNGSEYTIQYREQEDEDSGDFTSQIVS